MARRRYINPLSPKTRYRKRKMNKRSNYRKKVLRPGKVKMYKGQPEIGLYKMQCVKNYLNQTDYACFDVNFPFTPLDEVVAADGFYLQLWPNIKLQVPSADNPSQNDFLVNVGRIYSSVNDDLIQVMPTGLNVLRSTYIKYRTMCACYEITFRNSDDNDNAFKNHAFMICGAVFQNTDVNRSNYWNGNNSNGPGDVKTVFTCDNLKDHMGSQAFCRKYKGFNGKGQKVLKLVVYPYKIFGMTRAQWLASEHPNISQFIGNAPSLGDEPFLGRVCVTCADYSNSLVRKVSIDLKVKYYFRFEGTRIVAPANENIKQEQDTIE